MLIASLRLIKGNKMKADYACPFAALTLFRASTKVTDKTMATFSKLFLVRRPIILYHNYS